MWDSKTLVMVLQINKSDIPLWKGANGSFDIDVQQFPLDARLAPTDTALLSSTFTVTDATPITLGQNGSLNLGVKAGASAKLAALFRDHTGAAQDLVDTYQLAPSLTDKNLLLALQVGAKADLTAAASYQYSILSASAKLETGINASFIYVRPFSSNNNLGDNLADFVKGLRLPCDITPSPVAGEVVVLDFGGYLQIGASISAGYQLKGTKQFSIADLALSEHYDLSVIGTFAVTGRIAGEFSVEVRAGAKPGWANVKVSRSASRSLQIAADLKVDAHLTMEGLPTSSQEFLGAILGVQAKNWLNLISSGINQGGTVTNLDQLKSKLDGLANDFVAKWLGKGIDKITSEPEIADALAKINSVVTSYQNLDQSAIALFDRFFDPVASQIESLTGKLNFLQALPDWSDLPAESDSILWNVLRQLTKGDPLGAILGGLSALRDVQKLATQALTLITDAAHTEIRNVIAIAKSNFPLDRLLNELDTVDTPEKLKAGAATLAGHFVSRLIGKALDEVLTSDAKVKQIVKALQAIKAKKDTIFGTLDKILAEAAKQSLSLKLHAEYDAASSSSALIDCDLNLNEELGRQFMQAAGRGDFSEILAGYKPSIVDIRAGRLTHNVTKSTAISVNITGWHFNFSYSAMDRLITNLDQQIKTNSDGSLLISTDESLSIDSKEDRNAATDREQSVQTNFLLRYLGQTTQTISDKKFDDATKQYLIDVITSSAVYTVNITDASTTQKELEDLFHFAAELGLGEMGATAGSVVPLLQSSAGNFGKVEAQYEVRYTQPGLDNLARGPWPPLVITRFLKTMVLSSYAGRGLTLHEVALAFCSPAAFENFLDNPVAFRNPASSAQMVFNDVVSPIPGVVLPSFVRLTQTVQIMELGALFASLVKLDSAISDLRSVLDGGPIPAALFQKRLQGFGEALLLFKSTSMKKDATFAVFDHLIQLNTDQRQARSSALQITFTRDNDTKTVVYTLAAAQAALGAHS